MAMDPSASRSHEENDVDERELHPAEDLVEYLKRYAKENPEMVAVWSFTAGFLLGWKLKPW